jgi:hypothetical protein
LFFNINFDVLRIHAAVFLGKATTSSDTSTLPEMSRGSSRPRVRCGLDSDFFCKSRSCNPCK